MSRNLFDGYVINVVRAYPQLKAELEDKRNARIVLTPTGGGGSSTPGKPVERAALVQLGKREQRYLDAVEGAIRETRALPDGEERLRVIDLLFWSRTRTMNGVARELNMSYRTVRRKRGTFLKAVARRLNL